MLTVTGRGRRALALGLLLSAATATAAGDGPRCYGAPARDPASPCHDPALDRTVRPTPRQALSLRNAPCEVVRVEVPFVCAFGAPLEGAERTVALIGDSHATHWRPALGPVAEARGWHGLSATRAGCPLSTVTPILPRRLLPDCLRWRRAVPAWLAEHPEIDTVVVSQHRVRTRAGFGAEVAGYMAAWRGLPATVRHVVVVRDTPLRPTVMRRCVKQAIAKGLRAGVACRYPRAAGLRPDPAAVAAQRARARRVGLVDLSRFMCGERHCYPVVGGALVHKDITHLTAPFAETMAPYLGRAMKRLGV